MARRRTHDDDTILDAARDLLAHGGPSAATTAAISTASGAPIGSLYHRFGSRTELFAKVWLRTVGRFQAGLLAATADLHGPERVLAASAWTVDFAVHHPDDARLLMESSKEQLLGTTDLDAALRTVNDSVVRLLRELAVETFGAATPADLDVLTIAVVDVPYAIVRRHLRAGTSPEASREHLLRAVRALLDRP